MSEVCDNLKINVKVVYTVLKSSNNIYRSIFCVTVDETTQTVDNHYGNLHSKTDFKNYITEGPASTSKEVCHLANSTVHWYEAQAQHVRVDCQKVVPKNYNECRSCKISEILNKNPHVGSFHASLVSPSASPCEMVCMLRWSTTISRDLFRTYQEISELLNLS